MSHPSIKDVQEIHREFFFYAKERSKGYCLSLLVLNSFQATGSLPSIDPCIVYTFSNVFAKPVIDIWEFQATLWDSFACFSFRVLVKWQRPLIQEEGHTRKATFFNMAIIEAILSKFMMNHDATSGNGGVWTNSVFSNPPLQVLISVIFEYFTSTWCMSHIVKRQIVTFLLKKIKEKLEDFSNSLTMRCQNIVSEWYCHS